MKVHKQFGRSKKHETYQKKQLHGQYSQSMERQQKVCFGIVGTVGDFLHEGIFEYCDYSPETWAFIPTPGTKQNVYFEATREAALKNFTKQQKERG